MLKKCVATFFAFTRPIIRFVMQPVREVLRSDAVVYTTPTDAFVVYVKIVALAGLVLAMPVIFYQLWWAATGRSAHKRWLAMRFGFLATGCIIGGALFSHFVLFPWAWRLLAGFVPDGIQLAPSLSMAFSFYAKLVLNCGLVCQIPATVFLLARVGAVTPDFFVRNIAYAAVVIVSIAAYVTQTGDPITLLLAAAPLFTVYGLSVLIARRFARQPLTDPADPSPFSP